MSSTHFGTRPSAVLRDIQLAIPSRPPPRMEGPRPRRPFAGEGAGLTLVSGAESVWESFGFT